MDMQALARRYTISWFALSVLHFGFPLFAHAAEAPGGMTILVKDEITDRPLTNVQITITDAEAREIKEP